MTSILVFVAVTIIVVTSAIAIYQIINQKVIFKVYNPYRKLVIVTLLSLPLMFLFFPFTTDWSTYWTLVIVRVPFTIIWLILTIIGLILDIRMQKK